MSTILVVDDRAIFREPLAVCLRQNGYIAHTAENGRDALDVVARHPPDLILLDVAMPEMDGIEFLRTLRRNPNHQTTPVVLLTAVVDRKNVVEVARLGVKDYLLKSAFSLEDMLGRVRSRLMEHVTAIETPTHDQKLPDAAGPQPSPAQKPKTAERLALRNASTTASSADTRVLAQREPIITRDELVRIITKGLELKPLAPIVQSVMAATSNSNCSGDDVARAVAQDQALSIRVLRLANAATYSRGRPMQSLKDAISRIGTQEVRHLVMAIGVLESYEGAISEHVDARLFWEHSIGCGKLASALGRACKEPQWENLFLSGTLHDVGRLVLCEHVADKYAEVCAVARDLSLPLEMVESKLLLLDHCAILERALEHWHFTRDFITPVAAHHQTPQVLNRLKPEQSRSSLIIALANRLAHALLLGSSGNNVIYPINELLDFLRMDAEILDELIQDVASATDIVKLSVLSQSHEGCWSSMPDKVRAWLQKPVSALCVSDTPGKDPYPILFQRIEQGAGNPENIAVAHLSDARNQLSVLAKLQKAETDRHTHLPIIVVCERGQIDTMHASFQGRSHRVLRGPVRLEALVEAINSLLSIDQ